MFNWKQQMAIKKTTENRLRKILPDIDNDSGIYVWYRPVYKMYIGQSIKILDRSISHCLAYDHLGLSIKKWGLFDKDKNPKGWKLKVFKCDQNSLNDEERKMIEKCGEDNILYNITSGGQNEGKYDIQERAKGKGYRDGIKQGELNSKKEIKVYFDKYLDFAIKGETNKIKERKFNEFKEWLEK